MTTPASITRAPCARCNAETLHASGRCVHCNSEQASLPVRELASPEVLYRNGIQVLKSAKPGPKSRMQQRAEVAQRAEAQAMVERSRARGNAKAAAAKASATPKIIGDGPCAACKLAPREVGSYCRPCRKAYNASYHRGRRAAS